MRSVPDRWLRATFALIAALFLLARLALAADAATNLLQNADFALRNDADAPLHWKIGSGQTASVDPESAPPGLRQSLRVELTRDEGSSYGEVYQTISVRPQTLYRLEGCLRSTKAGFAFLSIKWLQNGTELKRFALPKSGTEWTAVSHVFSTETADTIQVLCRWERNAARGWLGQRGWFAGLRLTEAGPAPAPPEWVAVIARAATLKPLPPLTAPVHRGDRDLFVTPDGAGTRDGSSWSNALPGNAPGALAAAWEALAPGRTCRLGSGIYIGVHLPVSSGGTGPDATKRLLGEDTGQGQPWLVGNWRPDAPESGMNFVSFERGVSFCEFAGLRLACYQTGFHSTRGQHVGLRIRHCEFYEFRWGIFLNGLAYADHPAPASHDLEFAHCRFVHFTKSAVRLQAGNYDVRLLHCYADSGGRDWMKESFQIGFFLGGDHPRRQSGRDPKTWAPEHDITFIDCEARNMIYSQASYWQGDGFCAENDVYNLAFINCAAFDNADGGWDNKARNVVFVNCVSLRNKMNFRIWQQSFFFNCLSAQSFKRGGSWTSAGLWSLGNVHAAHTTFHNNQPQQIFADAKDGAEARISLQDCLVSCDPAHAAENRLFSSETRVTRRDTTEWLPPAGTDPGYPAAPADWTGTPHGAFDSGHFGPARGYHSSVADRWRQVSDDQLLRAARSLLQQTNWQQFLATVSQENLPAAK
jgi:hypothetical protein